MLKDEHPRSKPGTMVGQQSTVTHVLWPACHLLQPQLLLFSNKLCCRPLSLRWAPESPLLPRDSMDQVPTGPP